MRVTGCWSVHSDIKSVYGHMVQAWGREILYLSLFYSWKQPHIPTLHPVLHFTVYLREIETFALLF